MGSAGLAECFSNIRTGGQAEDTPSVGQLIATRHLDLVPIVPPNAPPQVLAMLQQRVVASLTRPVMTTGDVPGAATLREYLDLVYEYLERIGFSAPMQRPRIYVSACGGKQDAFAFGTRIHVTLEMGFEDPELRKVVVPHELVHVFQSDYEEANDGARDWPVEALATAVEHGLAPEVMRWSDRRPASTLIPRWFSAMNRSLRCPEEPFHSSFRGRCRMSNTGARAPFRDGVPYSGDYSKFLFFLMLRARAGQATEYGAWWQRFRTSPGPSSVVTDQQISDFQFALLGDEIGPMGTSPAFGLRVREELTAPGSGLDRPTLDPARYTYLFDAATQELRSRTVPGGGPLSRAPQQTRLSAEGILPSQGAAVRILVEAPNVSIGRLMSAGAMSTITFRHTGSPLVQSRLISGAPEPATRFAALDIEGTATRGWVPVPAGPQITRQYVLVVVTAAQTPTAVEGEYGVQLGPRCSELCQQVYRPRLPACCPAACQCPSPPPDCLDTCRAQADEYARNLCASICNADDQSYDAIFTDPRQATVPGKICGPANPTTTPSGLVDVQFQGLTCDEMGVDRCG